MQPELRAIDAYNPRERLVEWVRGFGVTTMHTGHGPGALDQRPDHDRQDARRRPWSGDASCPRRWSRPRSATRRAAPRTEVAGHAAPRWSRCCARELVKAQEYAAKREAPETDKEPARDLKLEMLARVLEARAAAAGHRRTAHRTS